jgi:sodium transport system permease protein
LFPGVLFHFLNNAFAVLLGFAVSSHWVSPILNWIYRNPADGLYHGGWIAGSAVVSALLLYYLWRPAIHRTRSATPVGAGSVEPTY